MHVQVIACIELPRAGAVKLLAHKLQIGSAAQTARPLSKSRAIRGQLFVADIAFSSYEHRVSDSITATGFQSIRMGDRL